MAKKKNKHKKELRKSEKRRIFNLKTKNHLKALLKNFRLLVSNKEIEKAKNLLPNVYKALDKAAKQGVIKKGNANRKKSVMARMLASIEKKQK